jgi:Sec-independent protein translocase protein TatA
MDMEILLVLILIAFVFGGFILMASSSIAVLVGWFRKMFSDDPDQQKQQEQNG